MQTEALCPECGAKGAQAERHIISVVLENIRFGMIARSYRCKKCLTLFDDKISKECNIIKAKMKYEELIGKTNAY